MSAKPRSLYIVSQEYDWAFFLFPPLIALCLGALVSGSSYSDAAFVFIGEETTWAQLSLGALIHAHLVAVFFRSHGNRAIFPLYPKRFIWVPLLLWMAIMGSAWVAVAATVVATFWDVWHSGAQTFGFARIYDRNAGLPTLECRRLEFWMNQLLYAGPILAGATMMDHVSAFDNFASLSEDGAGFGTLFFTRIPIQIERFSGQLTIAVLLIGTLVTLAYLWGHYRLWRRGHPISVLKIYLVATTGLCSIYSWGLNSWGEAFFIMNLFHAVQYLALVWATERKSIQKRFASSHGSWLTALLFFGPVALYGIMAQAVASNLNLLWSLTIVISLMHFWYDSFVWSVRAKQI